MLFNFHTLVNFSVFLLLLISSFLPLRLQKTWHDFSLLKFKTCFVAQHVISPGECPMYIWEGCVFCVCLLSPIGPQFWFKSCVLTDLLSSWCIHCWKLGVKIYYHYMTIYPFNSVSVCFTYMEAVLLDAYLFIIVVSS